MSKNKINFICTEEKRLLKAEQKAKSKEASTTDVKKTLNEDQMDSNLYREHRINKIKNFKDKQYDPYTTKFKDKLSLVEFISRYSNIETGTHLDEITCVAERVYTKRKSGSKLVFFDIMSENVKLQVLANANFYECPEKFSEIVENIKCGDIIGVVGHPAKSKLGEVSIIPTFIQILGPCLIQMPHLHYGFKDQESRYRNRCLDMIMNFNVIQILRTRTKIINFIRKYLEKLEFIEVETPILNMIQGGAAARPFKTHHNDFNMDMYLRISPELSLKKLIIGGMHRVFEIGKQFRNESVDLTHNPEFTTVEFYMTFADYFDLISITEDLLSNLTKELFGGYIVSYNKDGKAYEIDFSPPYKQIDMMTGLEEVLNIKLPLPSELYTEESRLILDKICVDNNVECAAPRTTARLLDNLVGEYLEKKCINPTFIMNHPEIMSPLAQGHRNIPYLTERFELFIMKKELCNAYTELSDPIVQRQRFEQQAKDRASGDEEAMLIDETFLEAMELGMPPTAGWGLGIDRLTMFLMDTNNIKEVLPFPVMKPECGIKNK